MNYRERVENMAGWRELRSCSAGLAILALIASISACGGGVSSPPKAMGSTALQVTKVSPNSGPTTGGTVVTIDIAGSTLQKGTKGVKVSFGGADSTAVTVSSATQIQALTPAHAAGKVDVKVTNSDGTTGDLASGFDYTDPPLAISSISPNSGLVAGGTPVTVTGSGFQSGATLSFGGLPANGVNVTSSTQIQAATPAHAAGTVDVQVTNPNGKTGTLAQGFTFLGLQITTSGLPDGNFGVPYQATLSATGGAGALTWAIVSGQLPPGLALDSAKGVIAGVPKQLGQLNFVVQVSDSSSPTPQTASKPLSINLVIASATGPIPSSLFGMNLINKANWPTVPVGALGKGTLTTWPYSEPTRGSFNWANLDAWVATAQNHGVDFFFSNELVPPWAAADQSTCGPTYPGSTTIGCTSMVANIQDWDDFVTALVTRYKGKIQIYELWNEPQHFTGTVADMVALTQHMYDKIRSLDPGAVIISPSAIAPYLDSYFAAGGVKTVDVISLHGYPDPKNDVAESINGFLTQPLKTVLAKYGLSSKPLWDTEGSWGDESAGAITDPDLQVAFVARFYLLHWSDGIGRLCWYAWDSASWGTLWDSVNGAHPAATAYQQVHNWMVGATMNAQCSVASDSTWTCGFTRSGGYQAQAVWNTATTKAFTPASIYTQYRDLSGKTVAIPSGSSVAIGAKPILLETFTP